MPNFDVLAHTVLSGSATEVEFAAISGDYQHLMLFLKTQDTYTGATSQWFRMRLNSDTGSNYKFAYAGYAGTSREAPGSIVTYGYGFYAGRSPSDNVGSDDDVYAGTAVILPFYSGTAKYKNFLSTLVINAEPGSTWANGLHFNGRWADTAAITTIKFYPDSQSFAAGTEMTLYGITGA